MVTLYSCYHCPIRPRRKSEDASPVAQQASSWLPHSGCSVHEASPLEAVRLVFSRNSELCSWRILSIRTVDMLAIMESTAKPFPAAHRLSLVLNSVPCSSLSYSFYLPILKASLYSCACREEILRSQTLDINQMYYLSLSKPDSGYCGYSV